MFAVKAKEKMDLDDDERTARFIQEQVEKGAATEKNVREAEYTELKRDNEDEKCEYGNDSFIDCRPLALYKFQVVQDSWWEYKDQKHSIHF